MGFIEISEPVGSCMLLASMDSGWLMLALHVPRRKPGVGKRKTRKLPDGVNSTATGMRIVHVLRCTPAYSPGLGQGNGETSANGGWADLNATCI